MILQKYFNKGVFRYESYGNRKADRRFRQGGYSKGNPPHPAYPRGRPVTDNIDTVAENRHFLIQHRQKVKAYIVQVDEGAFDIIEKTPTDGIYPQRVCYTTIIPLDKWYNNYLRIILRDHYERIHENRKNSP